MSFSSTTSSTTRRPPPTPPRTRDSATNSISTTFPLRNNSTGRHHGSTTRSISPDHDTSTSSSGNATALTTARYPLRKTTRPNSHSAAPAVDTASVHMRRLSGLHKTLSFPTFRDSDDSRPLSAHSTNDPSTPTFQPSSNQPNRSPSQKRKPPASHSSYGVDSTLGPPPSYSTQRTLSQDRIRATAQKLVSVTDRVSPLNEGWHLEQANHPEKPPSETLPALPAPPAPRSSDPDFSSSETVDSLSLNTPREGSDTTSPTSAGGTNMTEPGESANTGLGLDGTHEDAKASSSDETQKSEDLFLNIAKTDASRPGSSRARRSRISLPFLSGTRPSTAAKSSPMAAQFESSHLTTRSDRPLGKRSSLGQHVPGALTSSTYFDDTRSFVGRPSDQQSVVGSVDNRSQLRSRRHSNANVDTLRPPTRSRTSRMASEGLYTDRFQTGEQVATESTISTTAPSTVWDELDDLKSRIRKLELTGKLPPSSAAAMTSNERPRTATTAATTLSSSPKNNKLPTATLASAIEGVSSTVHPLLHEALSNAKTVVNQDVYQKLQSTAQDALQLSSMLSQEGYGSNGSPLSPQTERQIRRRTENMCRSLTELAIAMHSDARIASSPTARPVSREQHIGSASTLRTRTFSNETPIDRPPVTSRVQSRLDNRRTSLLLAHSNSQPSSSPLEATPASGPSTFRTPPASVVSQPMSSRISRTSTVTRSIRAQNHSFLDGATDNEEESSPSLAPRPVSRAMTEVTPSSAPTSYRSLARDRAMFSREYTKQHPLPGPAQKTQKTVIDPASLASRMPMPANIVTNNTRIMGRRTFPSPAEGSPSVYDSPNTPSHGTPTHIARPPFTISVERRPYTQSAAAPEIPRNTPSTSSINTPESVAGSGDRRTSSTRRSLGFASRISNVSSRLKAARAERIASTTQSPIGANVGVVRSGVAGEKDIDGHDGVENMIPSSNQPEQRGNAGAGS